MELEAFLAKWWKNEGSERANKDSFLNDLCAVLGVEPPHQSTGDRARDAYVFEADVPDRLEDGTESIKKIDLYKRGHFILEAKQYGNEDSAGKSNKPRRMSERWYEAMGKAFRQAKRYAYLLNEIPPFIIACDIGYCFDIYCSFGTSGEFNRFDVPSSGKRIPCRVFLNDLRDDKVRATLKAIFETPAILDLTATSQMVTTHVSEKLAVLAKGLEEKHAPDEVATFLIRCIFTMFAEDVELLPGRLFTRALREFWLPAPEGFKDGVESLWQAMNKGGPWAFGKVLRFNGGLFANPVALPLDAGQIKTLLEAADKDWSLVEPAIFGTLIEQALEEKERHSLGAHFTPRAYVERLVEPTVMQPLREEWERVQQEVYILVGKDKVEDARKAVREFQQRLASTRVLDPACGTGNFLYVSLDLMKQLEDDVLHKLAELGDTQGLLEVGSVRITPAQFLGIEKNPRAVPIAELVLWIGYLRWHFRQRGKGVLPPEPVLQDFGNIECRDAVLAWDGEPVPVLDETGQVVRRWDGESRKPHPATGEMVPDDTETIEILRYINPRRAEWPKADFVVGNPPFVTNKRMRVALGAGYVDALRLARKDVPDTVDYVMYWWSQAADLVRASAVRRMGLITTNSITQTFSRRVVADVLDGKPARASILFAIPDHPWAGGSDGAAVRVAMTVVGSGEQNGILNRVISEQRLDLGAVSIDVESTTGQINPDLTIGATASGATRLLANSAVSYMGVTLIGDGFRLSAEDRDALLGPRSSDHVKPYIMGRDLAQVFSPRFVIDFFGISEAEAMAAEPALYEWILNRVRPERAQNPRRTYRERWWVLGEPRDGMRRAIRGLDRYIATTRTAKHRVFQFVPASALVDSNVIAVAVDDSWVLGVLSSRAHCTWADRAGATLEDRPHYTPTTTFEPFPFPAASEQQKDRIRSLGAQLDAHRKRQLGLHSELTITALYNVLDKVSVGTVLNPKEKVSHDKGLVSTLGKLHSDLDAAVFDAYGWPHDLTDEQILERLVALNAERAEEERKGIIRWLRPEFQNAAGAAQQTELETEAPEAEEEAASAPRKEKAKIVKQPWPTKLKERLEAVHNLLRDAGTPLPLAQVTGAFKAAKASDVEEVLESLAAFQRAIPQESAGGTMWVVG